MKRVEFDGEDVRVVYASSEDVVVSPASVPAWIPLPRDIVVSVGIKADDVLTENVLKLSPEQAGTLGRYLAQLGSLGLI